MANFRSKVDVRKVITNLRPLNLPSQFQTELFQRLTVLSDDPYVLKQVGGCCGFNVIITILLIHGDTLIFSDMLKCAFGGDSDKATGYDKATQRLEKFYPGALSGASLAGEKTNTHPIDARISLGLVRFFRVYCKRNKRMNLWDECEQYSKCWDWEKGAKLSDNSTEYNALHYKKGDLALTLNSLEALLNLFGGKFSLAIQGQINSNILQANNAIDRARSWARGIFTAKRGRYIIAAVNVNGWGNLNDNPKLRPYDNINHWVVIPRINNDNGESRQIASWGERQVHKSAVIKVFKVSYEGLCDSFAGRWQWVEVD